MAGNEDNVSRVSSSARVLADAMPRAMIAEGRAEGFAEDWVERVKRATAAGLPAFPRYPFEPAVREGLFEARRAGRLVRGLEGAESALETQELGLARAPATRPDSDRRRVSRLLVVSADGSARFYRAVERLLEQFRVRLEVVLLECDEVELGSAAFGDGRRARALLIDHKQAVVRFLGRLDETSGGSESAADSV